MPCRVNQWAQCILCNARKCSPKCADNGHYALRPSESDDNMDQKWKFETRDDAARMRAWEPISRVADYYPGASRAGLEV